MHDDVNKAHTEWALACPWTWMGLGVALAVCAAGGSAAAFVPASFFLFAAGLLCIGISLTLRFASPRVFLPAGNARWLQPVLTLVFLIQALSYTYWFGLAFFGQQVVLFHGETDPLHHGVSVVLWVMVVPWSGLAAWEVFRRWRLDPTISAKEEGAGLLLLTAGILGLALVTLRTDGPGDPRTLRLFFGAASMVAQVAAALVVVSQGARRLAVSFMILFHFGGILTAVMSAPPSPWLFSQMWTRIYRPYLEFMYLNNAYHFYAPEPGPASYLWFRIAYADPADANRKHLFWYKIPDVDERGYQHHRLALEYQRYLALTENTVPADPVPAFYQPEMVMKEGKKVPEWLPARFFALRLASTPEYNDENAKKDTPVGMQPLTLDPKRLRVPFHPFVPPQQQYLPPNANSKSVLSAYARHVAMRKNPDHPDWPVHSVKVYRIVHTIPTVQAYMNGVPPNDPEFYRPYYVGEFTPDGTLTDEDDPLLYWLLPMMRKDMSKPSSPIVSYVHKHAGDPYWLYLPDHAQWVEGP